MKYLFRILALPFIMCLHVISMIRLTIDYLRYGTELITHTKHTEKRITDVMDFLENEIKNK
jgi:hypothetical protein